ncbi:MAG TPA: peptidylprolyl isomerase, partial [Vicinamibacterales bacterium]
MCILAIVLQIAMAFGGPEGTAPAGAPVSMQPLRPGEVVVRIETSLGNIDVAVDTRQAPGTARNFLRYVDGKFYDGGRFHRATRPDNYVPQLPERPPMQIIQAGINPEKRNEGFPPIPLE